MDLNSFCIGIFGKSGSGKSTLLKEYAKKLSLYKKIVCISPNEDIKGFKEIWQARDIWENMEKGQSKLMVRAFQPDFLDIIINSAVLTRNWLILIDEMYKYQDCKSLIDLSQMRRHSNTSLVFTERRPATIDKRYLNECNIIVSFRQRENNVLKYLSEYMENDEIDVKNVLQNLDRYEYYCYSDNDSINGSIKKTRL